MIPLRDVIPARTFPVVTVLLVALNGLGFLFQLVLGQEEWPRLLRHVGVTASADDWRTLVPALFVHAGWLHVAPNLLVLWLFGENVEDRMGHGRFLVFYGLCGAAALLAHVGFGAPGSVPAVGSSGAVGGVLGGYVRLYRKSRILTLLPLPGNVQLAEVPVAYVMSLWGVVQLMLATGVWTTSAFLGILSPPAVIVGFASGALLVGLLRRPERDRVEWWDERPRSRTRADRA